MSDPEPLDPRRVLQIRQNLADAAASHATAQRLEESHVRYILLANAGGIIACLGIADALVGGKGTSGAISFAALLPPMWLFFVGMVLSGVIVSLQQKRAVYEADGAGRQALAMLKETGRIVPTPPPTFSRVVRKGLPHLTTAINVLGGFSQLCFIVGSVWGFVRIGAAH